MIKEPAKSTLKRYGLTIGEWEQMLFQQACMCQVCGREPDKFVIDHEHVRGWKKMKPAERRKYVRGLLCNRCNWQFLRRGMTADIALRICQYLNLYKFRNSGVDSPIHAG